MDKNIPLYGSIPFLGGEYTITYREEKQKGSKTTGRLSGYGKFPFEKYPDIPVIDFRTANEKSIWEAINLPDTLRPQEENSSSYHGTLETYLKAIRALGIDVWERVE
jgi:hypothetical protein